MKASDFDNKFDAGEDVMALLDLKKARRPGLFGERTHAWSDAASSPSDFVAA
jgi:hypothetical protein